MRTGKDEVYVNYKEALKLACNIKHDSKNCYAYVKSKQNARDKIEPLEGSAGHIIVGRDSIPVRMPDS